MNKKEALACIGNKNFESVPKEFYKDKSFFHAVVKEDGTALEYADENLKKNKWEILKLPVITQGGEPLWPQFWKLDELKEIKNSVSKEEWKFKWMQDSKNN